MLLSSLLLSWFSLLCCSGVVAAVGDPLNVAFVLPPASPMGAMLPVAHGLLDAGHNVTLLAFEDYETKLKKLVPNAYFRSLGPGVRPQMDEQKSNGLLSLPYWALPFMAGLLLPMFDVVIGKSMAMAALPILKEMQPDVLCVVNMFPSQVALSEAADVPAVGLAFSLQHVWAILDSPWSMEPTIGSWYTREEIAQSIPLAMLNTAQRMVGQIGRILGNNVNNYVRFSLGLKRMEVSQFEGPLTLPTVVPHLPELTAGYTPINNPMAVMAGMYDHPALHGDSLKPSEQHNEIIGWLDARAAEGLDVLYVAFGSEIIMDKGRLNLFLAAFEANKIAVLWALKKPPADFNPTSANTFISKWTPQKAVLAHPAVKGFLSHGGANSVRESVAAGVPLIIMPIMPDCPTTAMAFEEVGIAVRLDKNDLSPENIRRCFEFIQSEETQKRAQIVKQLNDKHASLDRAVEVVEHTARGSFRLRTKRQPSLLGAFLPIFWLAALVLGCCCCLKQLLCWCCGCCRSRSSVPESKSGKKKKKNE
eukprot:TRINITY_DN100490_c0_g1_i1.p1 TRINITY_DN100490_c0_g1~~TRINITY_DN100490_c0_g1_i1.p1  ORF type:complete len:532 (+),score=109.29 TRINITY_DN100490_c0_g1_i1:99-1694(+)